MTENMDNVDLFKKRLQKKYTFTEEIKIILNHNNLVILCPSKVVRYILNLRKNVFLTVFYINIFMQNKIEVIMLHNLLLFFAPNHILWSSSCVQSILILSRLWSDNIYHLRRLYLRKVILIVIIVSNHMQ